MSVAEERMSGTEKGAGKGMSPVSAEDFVPVPEGERDTDVIVRPSVSYWRDALRRITHDKVAMVSLGFIAVIVLLAVFAPVFGRYNYETNNLMATNVKPCGEHWFGTDTLGRDLWARVWVGARVSLVVGLFGKILRKIRWNGLPPSVLLASTNSRLLNCMMRPRIIRALPIQPTIAIAKTSGSGPEPRYSIINVI